MRITWIVSVPISQLPTGELTSELASARYRVLIPGLILSKRHKVNIVTIGDNTDVNSVKEIENSDILIISKSFSHKAIQLSQRANSLGIPLLLDICDDHFSTPQFQNHYRTLCDLASLIIASTDAMLSVISDSTGYTAKIIPDPYETLRFPPHFQLEDSLNLLWFGHPVNLDSLLNFLPMLNELETSLTVNLKIVTLITPRITNEISKSMENIRRQINVNLVQWSLLEMKRQFAASDIIIIPTLDNQEKFVKSPNRVIEAIWNGCYVVAGEIPSYQSFSKWVWVNNDLISGIHQAISTSSEIQNNIFDAQEYISQHHNPEIIAEAWEKNFTEVIESSSKRVSISNRTFTQSEGNGKSILFAAGAKKLNLGCGDKILPNYINVDVAESRAGARPDILCDLRDLHPFEDNSVDEILSVHVVEHFWRWEVINILKEWVRVLKPGGKMILECPNLISACEAFLENPELYAGEGPEGQRTMWVFYGDPKWQDPLMNHRWGYTPASLAQTMEDAGLMNMNQEPAQFKLREPRDMRIVGSKPIK